MTTPGRPEIPGLRIGFVPGVTMTKWRRIWEERFPRVRLELARVLESDQRRLLVTGELDMCFVRLPIDGTGFHTIPLYEEQPVVWMHKDFLLAALDEVTVEDLVEFRIVDDYGPDSIDLAVYNAAALRVPLSVARTQSRKDMVHRPVTDGEPTTIALPWRIGNDNEWIDEFIRVVRGRRASSSRTVKERGDSGKPAATTRKPARPTARGQRSGQPKRPRRR